MSARGGAAVDRDDQRVALAGAIADRLHQHAADQRAVLRLPGDFFLLPEREAAHLRVRIGQLAPRLARAGIGNLVDREDGGRRGAVGVVDQQHAGLRILFDRDAGFFLGQRPHRVVAHVERRRSGWWP